MEGVVDRRHRQARRRFAGYTVAGKTGTAKKLVNGSYSTVRLQRRRSSASCRRASRCSRSSSSSTRRTRTCRLRRLGGGADLPAHRRGGAAALRRAADDQRAAAAARRRGAEPRRREQPTSGPVEPPPIVTLADTPPARPTVFPDLAGLSARDALRALARLGLTRAAARHRRRRQQRPAGRRTPIDSRRRTVDALARTRHDVAREPRASSAGHDGRRAAARARRAMPPD